MEEALSETLYLAPARRTAFYDLYQRQYAQTFAWLQRALGEAAATRDQQRRTDDANHADLRARLAQWSGVAQIELREAGVEQAATPGDGIRYTVRTPQDLLYTGLLWDPPSSVACRGAVLLAGEEETTVEHWIAQYRAQGLRVILPALARPQHSFQEHPERKWYYFTDDELLHLFFFICGGSLAGLEAAEILTITQALCGQGAERLPVALHGGGRHCLTMAVAAALAPDYTQPYDLLLLPNGAESLDHQELDVRFNTIWNFHTDFDALTLFTLAGADLLFVEPGLTPSTGYGRALAWFGSQPTQPRVARLIAPDATAVATAVATMLAPVGAAVTEQPTPFIFAAAVLAEAYQPALASKVAFLEGLHAQARQTRLQRYDLATLTPADYRTRVAQSLERVAGPPLPAAVERKPQTRLVARYPAYALYEVTLASVPGVEVAGYLLLPSSGQPAPAVICQHGLGGRPDALVGIPDRLEGHQWVYDRFAQRLAERGYVVFVPFMNWGWATTAMRDRLVKHAYALGFAPNRFEVAQLHAVVDFLQARPEVIADRIAFYGLSYGGHASLWLCAQEERLAAVVTAGHFNEWQTKLLNPELSPPLTRPTAYVTVDEGHDMFNYNVLPELGHAELATRFVPRAQFVENGLLDTVTPTAWVEREFARTQAVFAWLGAADQVALEHFPGPHRVWAEGSFRFLEKHLRQARP
ncbi:MAG: dienelactone hydrolase family protein [Caldilineaceae bacterium]|nr:dienelactone hydrolase family protein [Caldilineaceae bacterium]